MSNTMPKMRLRTLPEAANYFKKNDPDTCVTEGLLRHLIKKNNLPHAKTGVKILLDLDVLERYFSGHPVNNIPSVELEEV